MAIQLVTKFLPYVDEMFTTESKLSLLTNRDFDWTGAHTVKAYKVSTAAMNDYARDGKQKVNLEVDADGKTFVPLPSRYGAVQPLSATTEEFTLARDRSFTFAIDKLDIDETQQVLSAADALARQNREVVIPEVDSYVYGVMTNGAGFKPEPVSLGVADRSDKTTTNIYDAIITASAALDNAEVPDTGRVLVVTPDVYMLMKQSQYITMETETGQDMRLRGVISNLDGMSVVKVPNSRLPEGFGFMLAHPVATVAPVKLEDFKIHQDPPGLSGSLVEGRICYDAFVLENKAKAIYYQRLKA